MKTVFTRLGQPHFHHFGATFSVTTMVRDAVPRQELETLREKRAIALGEISASNSCISNDRKSEIHEDFERQMEYLLNARRSQEHPFRVKRAAQIVLERLKALDDRYYILHAACVMSNHLHLLIDFSIQVPEDWDGQKEIPGYCNLSEVMRRLKGGISFQINKECQRNGTLWAAGYYDRNIRSAKHFRKVLAYIINNPVNAGLVEQWNEFPYTYLSEKLKNEVF